MKPGKKIYYEKVGKRYKPVYEYDQYLMAALPKGNHLIMVYPGGSSTRYNVDPNFAAMIAAGRLAEDAISKSIHAATEIRRNSKETQRRELTPGQKAAWERLVEEFGEDAKQLEWASVRECAEAGVKAMQEEADKLMQYESVRQAYEQFQLVCKLCAKGETDV